MRKVHIQGLSRLPAVAKDRPAWASGAHFDDAQWTVDGPEGPEKVHPLELDEAELVQAVTSAALADAGLGRKDVGFICSGSNLDFTFI